MNINSATNVEKIGLLADWLPVIVNDVKKDLKGEHLRSDPRFFKEYFTGKQRQKLGTDELVVAYKTEIVDRENDGLAEFITNRWLIKNTDLYDHFATFLAQINPDFDAIESIDDATAEKMIGSAEKEYGSIRTYIFAILNSVVFSEAAYSSLAERAKTQAQDAEKPVEIDEAKSIEALEKKHDREIRKLTDKFEKRLSGLEKKYHQDVNALKKQVGSLQRKVSEQSASC